MLSEFLRNLVTTHEVWTDITAEPQGLSEFAVTQKTHAVTCSTEKNRYTQNKHKIINIRNLEEQIPDLCWIRYIKSLLYFFTISSIDLILYYETTVFLMASFTAPFHAVETYVH